MNYTKTIVCDGASHEQIHMNLKVAEQNDSLYTVPAKVAKYKRTYKVFF